MNNSFSFDEIRALSEEHHKFIFSYVNEAARRFFVDPYDYLDTLNQDQLENDFKDKNLALHGGFIYFKDLQGDSVNVLKLHIPLKDYQKDGVLISDLIVNKVKTIEALKFILPINADLAGVTLTEHEKRAMYHIPITIYMPKKPITFRLYPDEVVYKNLEEIAFTIQQIDDVLTQASLNFGEKFQLSDDIAETDQRIGKYTTVTIDRDFMNTYISSEGTYRRHFDFEGAYVKDSKGKLHGTQVRQELLQKNSIAIDYIKTVMPYSKIFNAIHDLIKTNELNSTVAREDQTEEETKSEVSPGFFGEPALPLSKEICNRLLNSMRRIINGEGDLLELYSFKEITEISNDVELMCLINTFEAKYEELNGLGSLSATI